MTAINLPDSAWAAVVAENYRKVFGTALALTRHVAQAEDATQETFLRAYRYRHKFNGKASPGTWLHAIAVNVCADILRRERKLSHRGLESAADSPSTDPGPEESTDRRHVHAALREALNSLPDVMRQAFEQTIIQGYTYREVACIQKVSVGTIASRVARTRAAILRRCKGIELLENKS